MYKIILGLLCLFSFAACTKVTNTSYDRFPEGKNKKLITVKGIDVEDPDLSLTLFAKEPNFANPTNMDIDYKGRLWLCEAYNYRNDVNNIPYKKAGDRILILEDQNHDGVSDHTKIFYQGEDVNSALGIVVLGNKTIVSCSPNVLVFTDTNHDDIPDKKEILFKTLGGFQSDHGLHSMVFGSDGKLYFNFGNHVLGLQNKNGQALKDIYGREISNGKKPFLDGMLIRCDENATNFEVLGMNFRNPYELAVDSYGRMWQSDNDDDGKSANRINYVMPHGNFGYKDEITGADWREPRTNMEESVYLQHWHQNDPGSIPNIAQTLSGSPTGMVFYEGTLLPKKYQESVILGDAGSNEVNSYSIKESDTGITTTKQPILNSNKNDQWFRPSDVCVGIDGSVFVADWYDSGVGGHAVGDLDRGRVYRIAPKNAKLTYPNFDFNSISGLIEAFKSPNHAVRYMAYTGLKRLGNQAETALLEMYKNGNSIEKSRALWLLVRINKKHISLGTENKDPQIRAATVRMVAEEKENDPQFFEKMAQDPSMIVKNAVATGIYMKSNLKAWLSLTKSFQGQNRWFLEALGIGATNFWDDYLSEFLKNQKTNWLKNLKALDIIWRSRAKISAELLANIIENVPFHDSMKYFRAIDFQEIGPKNDALVKMIKIENSEEKNLLIFKHFDQNSIVTNPVFIQKLNPLLNNIKNDVDFVEIVNRYKLKNQKTRLTNIMYHSKDPVASTNAAYAMVNLFGTEVLRTVMNQRPINKAMAVLTINKLGLIDNAVMANEFIKIFSNNNYPFEIREAAVLAMDGYFSDEKLWNLMKLNKVSKELMPAAMKVCKSTMHMNLLNEFLAKYKNDTQEKSTITPPSNIKISNGNATNGLVLYKTYCVSCHQVGKLGVDFGPALTQIGKKLTNESIYNAIINPNQGISFGYEGYDIVMNDGSQLQGMLASKTNDKISIKMPGQSEMTEYDKNKIKSMTKMSSSLMPAFQLKPTEYADLVAYLSKLK